MGRWSARSRSGAWCIRVDGVVAAGMIVTPIERAAINWLAVRRSMRGQGFGRDRRPLMRYARFEGASEVIVDTFGNDNVEGRPARRLDQLFGFIAAEELERGPEGGTRQRYRLETSVCQCAAVELRGRR